MWRSLPVTDNYVAGSWAQADMTAVERWKILKGAILAASRRSQDDDETITRASVRSFTSFELFKVTDLVGDVPKGCVCSQAGARSIWKRYTYVMRIDACATPSDEGTRGDTTGGMDGERERVSALISHLPPKTSLEVMMGFNNTGNVCIWPSEEVLAHYCLENREHFRGKSVCELGGGMTCLAGLMLALTGLPARVMLTDGNTASVENVRRILSANKGEQNRVEISSNVLLWDEAFVHSEHSTFDFVICADCLFFVELHQILCQVIRKLLVPGGTALLLNPTRSGTLEQFVKVAENLFAVKRSEKYSELVWEKHCASLTDDRYKSDLHYPVLLVLEPLRATS